MSETVNLATPLSLTRSNWRLVEARLNLVNWSILLRLLGDDGTETQITYTTPPGPGPLGLLPSGRSLLIAFNTANFSTTSLTRRLLQQLVTDGFIVGAVTGTPEQP